MLLRVLALAAFAAVATVDVCAAPSDAPVEATATAGDASPVAPWMVLLKPDGEDGATLVPKNVGDIDPGPGQRYSWQSLTATLGFIAQALARIPIVWITGNASATALPPQRVSVVPLSLPTPTVAAAPAPSTAPATALDDWRDADNPDDVITDLDVDETGIALAQVFDDDSALGEGVKKKIMEETLSSIANSIAGFANFPGAKEVSNALAEAEATARAIDKQNVAVASEVHNTVQNNQPITNTFNIVESPGVTLRPHLPLVKPTRLPLLPISNTNSLDGSDGRLFWPRRPYRTAPSYNGCNGLASCLNRYKSKILENTMDSVANSIMLFPNLIAGSRPEIFPAYETRDYGYKHPHPYVPYVPKATPTNNVAVASEVYNAIQNNLPITNTFNFGQRALETAAYLENAEATKTLATCINNYEKKILKNTLLSLANSVTTTPAWTTSETAGTTNVANAVAIDNGAYDSDFVTDNSVAPVVEVVSPSYVIDELPKLKGEPQIVVSSHDGLSSFVDNLESSIVKHTMASIANSMALPALIVGTATQSGYGTTDASIANAVAIDKEVTRPVIETVRPSHIHKKYKISSLKEANTGLQVTDGLYKNDVLGSGNIANAVAIDDAFSGNVIVDSDDSKSTIDGTQWDASEGEWYSGGSIANAVAIDKGVDVSTHPLIKIVTPSYVTNKHKLSSIKETNSGLKVTGDYSNYGVLGSQNIANAVAIDEDAFRDKITFVSHDSQSTNTFKETDSDLDETPNYSTYSIGNIANAVAIDEPQDAYDVKEAVEVQSHTGGAYAPTHHTGNIATAVAVDDTNYDNKGVLYDDSKFTNLLKETNGVHHTGTEQFSSYTTGNVANAVAIDSGSTDDKAIVFEDSVPTNAFKPNSEPDSTGPAVYSTYMPWNIANAVAIDEGTYNDKKETAYDVVVPMAKETFDVSNYDKDVSSYINTNIANAVAIDENIKEGIQYNGNDNKEFTYYVDTKSSNNNEEKRPTPVHSTFYVGNVANAIAIDEDSSEGEGVTVDSKKIKPVDITSYVGNVANAVAIDGLKTEDLKTIKLKGTNNKVDFSDGATYSTHGTGAVANAVAIDKDFYDEKVDDSEVMYTVNIYDDTDYDTVDVESTANVVAVDDVNYETDESGTNEESDAFDNVNYHTYTGGNVANAVAIDNGDFKSSGHSLESAVPSYVTYKISGSSFPNIANAVAIDTDKTKVHVGDSLPVSVSQLEEERYKSKIAKETLQSIANSIILPKWTTGVASSTDFGTAAGPNVANAVAIDNGATTLDTRPIIKIAAPAHAHANSVDGFVKTKSSHFGTKGHAYGTEPWTHGATNSLQNVIEGFKSNILRQTLNSISNSMLPMWPFGGTHATYSTHDTTGSANIANAVAVDQKTVGAVRPAIKIVRPSYVVDKHKLSTHTGHGTGNIANAVAIDKGDNEFKASAHIGKTDTTFYGIRPVNGAAHYGNVANAVAIDKATSDAKLIEPYTANFLEKAALPYGNYYSHGTPSVANAVAID